MTTVLLLRHGRTNANLTGVLAGRTPGVELDDVGVKQAAESAARIAPLPIRGVVTSPLRRCRQTARAVLNAREDRVPLSTESGLVECGYGDWTGKKLRELTKEKLWRTVQQQPSAVRFPNGEAMTEMSGRAVAAVRAWDQRFAAEHGDDAIWVAVSHGDVIKAILADALGMHLDTFQRIMVDPASISVIHYAETRPFVLRMNSVGQDLQSLIPKEAPRKAAKKSAGRRSGKAAARSRSTRKASSAAPRPSLGGGLGTGDIR